MNDTDRDRMNALVRECHEYKAQRDKLAARVGAALALTDTGSAAFREAFPEYFSASGVFLEGVPGWRVAEKIRDVLNGG